MQNMWLAVFMASYSSLSWWRDIPGQGQWGWRRWHYKLQPPWWGYRRRCTSLECSHPCRGTGCSACNVKTWKRKSSVWTENWFFKLLHVFLTHAVCLVKTIAAFLPTDVVKSILQPHINQHQNNGLPSVLTCGIYTWSGGKTILTEAILLIH